MSKFWPVRTTGNVESVDYYLYENLVTPKPPSSDELLWAAEWLSTYDVGYDEDDVEMAQQIANVIGFLVRKADEMNRRKVINDAKRAYAEQHGIPVSRVRVVR